MATRSQVRISGSWMRSGLANPNLWQKQVRAKNTTAAQPIEESRENNLMKVLQNHGVGDGVRTRDVQIHSLALYQLSYTHRIAMLR